MADEFASLRSRFESIVGGLKGPVPVPVLNNYLFGAFDPITGMPPCAAENI
jgi:hypothetical protein